MGKALEQSADQQCKQCNDPSHDAKFYALPLWNRDDVAAHILNGDAIFIYRSRVVRPSQSWLSKHPGGDLAILHFVGRDATDEVDAFHIGPSLKQLIAFSVARVHLDHQHGWQAFVPPYMSGWSWKNGKWQRNADTTHNTPAGVKAEASGYAHNEINPSSQILLVEKGTTPTQSDALKPSIETISPPPSILSNKDQLEHSEAYKILHKRVEDAGLYKTRLITGLGPDLVRYIIFISLALWFYQKKWYIPSAFFLGIFWHQLAFFAHDLGHMGVTHSWTWDRIISIFIADFCGGLSIGWWVDVSPLRLFRA